MFLPGCYAIFANINDANNIGNNNHKCYSNEIYHKLTRVSEGHFVFLPPLLFIWSAAKG